MALSEKQKAWEAEVSRWIGKLSSLKHSEISSSPVFHPKNIDEATCGLYEQIDTVIVMLNSEETPSDEEIDEIMRFTGYTLPNYKKKHNGHYQTYGET